METVEQLRAEGLCVWRPNPEGFLSEILQVQIILWK